MDGAGEVERLAPLPHQYRPPPQAFAALALAHAGAVAAALRRRYVLPPEAAALAEPSRAEETARGARDAAGAGGHGAGHFAEEAGHGWWSVPRWC